MGFKTYKVFFDNEVNTSLQAKPTTTANDSSNSDTGSWDLIYYANVTSSKQTGDVELLGSCIAISDNRKTIDVYVDDATQLPDFGAYFLFGKSNTINTSGLTGYYGEVQLKNDSTSSIELFSVSSEVVQSSK